MKFRKILFEICYLTIVIVGGGLTGYYLSYWGIEFLNTTNGVYESFFRHSLY